MGRPRNKMLPGETTNEYHQRRRVEDPDFRERRRAAIRKCNYGVSLEIYNAMLASQDGVCAICRKLETRVTKGVVNGLGVDHDHATGAIRGLLCVRCNTAIGMLGDDKALIKQALEYVEAYE